MTFITGYCILRNCKIFGADLSDLSAKSAEEFLDMSYEKLGLSYPKFYKMDIQSRFGLIASEMLLRENPVSEYESEAIAVILSNANASLDTDGRFQVSTQQIASPSLFVYTLANIVAGEICIRHGLTGENAFFVTPEFDASLMKHYVDDVFLEGHTKACVAGWVDVSGEQSDVFLYLVESKKRGLALPHTIEELKRIYSQ